MGEKHSLSAKARTVLGRKVKDLRAAGLIPAVVYGGKDNPVSISLNANDFKKTYEQTGSSTLIELNVEGGNTDNVLAQEPQYNPVTGNINHVDFIRIRMDEKLTTEIPLEIVGESEAVEQLDGTLVTPRDNIEVECLPKDLVHEIKVDISVLKTFDDQIKVTDIVAPEGIEILTEQEEVIAMVEPPRSEEEMAELEKPTAEEEKEAVEAVAGKEEGAEDEEGAESAKSAETSTEGEPKPTEQPIKE